MMDYGGNERREFFRISDDLLLELRQVTIEEAEVLKNVLPHSNVLSGTLSKLPEKTLIPDDICTYLETLDRKIDLIIDMLSGKQMSFDKLCVEADISGSGIQFSSNSKLDLDTFVELRIGSALLAHQTITVLGKVVRCNQLPTEDRDMWNIAISFVAINEKDRDVLVNYIFSRERQYLLSRKEPLT
jgi:hypothetical protein